MLTELQREEKIRLARITTQNTIKCVPGVTAVIGIGSFFSGNYHRFSDRPSDIDLQVGIDPNHKQQEMCDLFSKIFRLELVQRETNIKVDCHLLPENIDLQDPNQVLLGLATVNGIILYGDKPNWVDAVNQSDLPLFA